MEYRQLPRGTSGERFSTLGLGLGGIQNSSEAEIAATVRKAIDHGINFFDLCAGAGNTYKPFGEAIHGQREKVFFQLHFGAVYDEKGAYGWSRDLEQIKRTFDWEMKLLGTDYIDLGYLHCVDELKDYEQLIESGVLAFAQDLKAQGVVRHLGFSSHTPAVAMCMLDDGFADMMMFSINAAYDFEQAADDVGSGEAKTRAALFRRCEKDGVGISVMKPFHAGKLLDAEQSAFHTALTRYQCLQYALDRPGVLTTVPGVRGMTDLGELLGFADAAMEEKDYSILGTFTKETVQGVCTYCGHCKPCPKGIDISLVNKYYDLARMGDLLAANHYKKLAVKASTCVQCGHCDSRCPFRVAQSARMKEIAAYFGE